MSDGMSRAEKTPLSCLREPGLAEMNALLGHTGRRPHHQDPALIEQLAMSASLSPFAFHWQTGERVYLFHSVLQKKLYGHAYCREALTFLSHPPRERLMESLDEKTRLALYGLLPLLKENHFLWSPDEDPRHLLDQFRCNRMLRVPGYRVLYLMLTHECNHRCPYCFSVFFSDARPSTRFMDGEVAVKGIDLFEGLLGDTTGEPVVILYGGEPVMNWPVLSAAVKYIRRKEWKGGLKGKTVSIELFTNGTLLTPGRCRFLKEQRVTVALSLEGREGHHSIREPVSPRLDSYRQARRALHHLREAGHDPAVSLTVGRHNLPDLADIVDYFTSELAIRDLRFFPVRGLPPGNLHETPPGAFTGKLLSLWPLLRERGIEENMLIDRVRLCAREEPLLYYCEAMGGQVAVMPDGSVGPCINCAEDYLQIWGKVGEKRLREKMMESVLTSQWLRRSPFFNRKCESCIGLGNCGGGCPHEAFTKTGSLDGGDDRHCSTHPAVTRWIVELLAGLHEETGRKGGPL